MADSRSPDDTSRPAAAAAGGTRVLPSRKAPTVLNASTAPSSSVLRRAHAPRQLELLLRPR